MQTIEDILPYYFHESTVVNLYLSKELFYFRFAIPEWYAYHDHPEIKEGECYLIDVLCRGNKIEELWIESGFFRFAGAEVLGFEIDIDGNGCLSILDDGHLILEFHCDSFEVKDVGMVDWAEIEGKNNNYDTKWAKLPVDDR